MLMRYTESISMWMSSYLYNTHVHTYNRFTALLDLVRDYPGEPAPERLNQEVKTNLDLLEQEIVSGNSISWAICKSALWYNQASIPPLSFLQAGCPLCCPTDIVKALKASYITIYITTSCICLHPVYDHIIIITWYCIFAFCALTLLVGWQNRASGLKKAEWWGAGMVIRLGRDADLRMAQLMPLPLTIS